MQRIRILRLVGEYLPIGRLGLIEASRLVMGYGVVDIGRHKASAKFQVVRFKE